MIDHSRLQELINDFGEEDLADLIDSFLEEAVETVDALEGTISEAYTKERAELFHFLKGCALNVGAMLNQLDGRTQDSHAECRAYSSSRSRSRAQVVVFVVS